MTPFVIYGLPRSRTAWLSRFLTYGDWVCGHEELRHVRSLDDVKAWFAQPCVGSAETAGAPWWRLAEKYAPGLRTVVVRRPVDAVVKSMTNLGIPFDRQVLSETMKRLDAKLDQIEARVPNVLSVTFDGLRDEAVCKSVFEYCLPYQHDQAWWDQCDSQNVQIDMRALVRYAIAYQPQLTKVTAIAKQQTLVGFAAKPAEDPQGVTIAEESYDSWVAGGGHLFEDHAVVVGEAPDRDLHTKNRPLFKLLYDQGLLQIMTARSNGRMFGYLMTTLGPSLESETDKVAVHTMFYGSKDWPGLGMKLQRAALRSLKEKGVDEVYFRAGPRGSGPKLGTLYRRLGAESDGESFRLKLKDI
jgi:hypothetical protein